MDRHDRWAARLSDAPSGRRWGRSALFLLTAVLAFPVIYTLGPTRLVSDSDGPSNPLERFDAWLAGDGHIDGNPGVVREAPSPATWVAVGMVVAVLIGLSLWSLRRPD